MEGSIGWLFDCVGVPQSSFCGGGWVVVSEEDQRDSFDEFLRAGVIQFGGIFKFENYMVSVYINTCHKNEG